MAVDLEVAFGGRSRGRFGGRFGGRIGGRLGAGARTEALYSVTQYKTLIIKKRL